MDYILQLREYIGHRPVLMVGAAILLLDENNRLLMMRRSECGRWGVPGGATEPGEVVEDAARRETFEEVNLEVGEMSLFGVFSGPELYYKYPNGDEVYNVTVMYWSRDWHGEIKLNSEHTEWNWFAANEIPEDISPPIRPILERFKRTTFQPATWNLTPDTDQPRLPDDHQTVENSRNKLSFPMDPR